MGDPEGVLISDGVTKSFRRVRYTFKGRKIWEQYVKHQQTDNCNINTRMKSVATFLDMQLLQHKEATKLASLPEPDDE